MKPKQLPDDLSDWLKAQTFVIGTAMSPSREPSAKSEGIRQRIKLVPLWDSKARALRCLAMAEKH
jgi:hypothetical protein